MGIHQGQLLALLARKSVLTLQELRAVMGLRCSLQAINVLWGKLGLAYKKPPCQLSKTAQKSRARCLWQRRQASFDLAKLIYLENRASRTNLIRRCG
jgi:hypothetical protein